MDHGICRCHPSSAHTCNDPNDLNLSGHTTRSYSIDIILGFAIYARAVRCSSRPCCHIVVLDSEACFFLIYKQCFQRKCKTLWWWWLHVNLLLLDSAGRHARDLQEWPSHASSNLCHSWWQMSRWVSKWKQTGGWLNRMFERELSYCCWSWGAELSDAYKPWQWSSRFCSIAFLTTVSVSGLSAAKGHRWTGCAFGEVGDYHRLPWQNKGQVTAAKANR